MQGKDRAHQAWVMLHGQTEKELPPDLVAPVLNPANIEVWNLFLSSSTQWRTGGFGVVGLDYIAVKEIASVMNITLNEPLLLKLAYLERLTLKQIEEEANKKNGS